MEHRSIGNIIRGVHVSAVASSIFDVTNPDCHVRLVDDQEISSSLASHEVYFRNIFHLLRKFRAAGLPLYAQEEWQKLDGKSQVALLVLDQKYPGDTIPGDDDPRWKQFDAPADKIEKQSGIRTRYWAKPGVDSSHLGAQAAERALQISGLDRQKVGAIICATTTPKNHATPCNAPEIKKLLGIWNENVFCTDITSACTSFASACQAACGLISSGMYKTILVIGTDVEETTTSEYDRNVHILLSSGALCMVFEACDPQSSDFQPHWFWSGSDASLSNLIVIPAGGSALQITPEMIIDPFDQRHKMAMDGPMVRKVAERKLLKVQKRDDGELPEITGAIALALEKAHLTFADIQFAAFHQANMRIINPVEEHMRELGFTGKVRNNIRDYGNMTSGSCGVCLDHAWQLGLLKYGDLVMMVYFGGGMTVTVIFFRWTLQGFPEEYVSRSFTSDEFPVKEFSFPVLH